jgi:hypothetical protein
MADNSIPDDLVEAFCAALDRYETQLRHGAPDDMVIRWGDRLCSFVTVIGVVAQYDVPMPAHLVLRLLTVPGVKPRYISDESYAASARYLQDLYASRLRIRPEAKR